MRFLNFITLKSVKFILLLATTLATTTFVFLPQSLFYFKKSDISFFPQESNIYILENEKAKPSKPPKNESSKLKLFNWQQKELNELKFKLQKLILDFKEFPISKNFSSFINDTINQINQAKYDDYWNLSKNFLSFFLKYDFWKKKFKDTIELITSDIDKQKQKEIFSKALILVKDSKIDSSSKEFLKKMQEFYIYKLQEQIKLYEQYPYYLQPLERLKKLLYYYQNHYEEYVDFQWGIDKNNKFSLEPDKYYSANFQLIFINDDYIKNWLKYYQRWNWIFVDNKNRIPKIQDKYIEALQIDEKLKNNQIISNYLKRQINFTPDKFNSLWTINSKNPENLTSSDVNRLHQIELDTVYIESQKKLTYEINKLYSNKKYNNFKSLGDEIVKDINFNNKKYTLLDFQNLKNFNYEKFWKYQNKTLKPDSDYIELESDFNIYNNLLWNQPNLFSDAKYLGLEEEQINPVQRRIRENGHIVDYTFKIKEVEAKKQGKEIWINPIPEYKRWFNHWKEVLPNIINKNWDTKTKIKAVAYYIATNSVYLSPVDKYFNYNGYGFYNPSQIFTNDPEIQCVGYSMNLAAALTILNIPVRILGGPYFGSSLSTVAEGGHAWNEVFVDGRWKAIDLTNWDLPENYNPKRKLKTFELDDSDDLFLERNSEWMNNFKLSLSSYQSTIMFFKNPPQYEYKGLPDSI
ncbi:transglutaminase-like domain-containing protein [Mycoplasmopsis citelli]|uniref:transglutaminase-like domain-containing protein n=1 Tax=Mycoplasmopsis citelli TaxID=171281 RepID=UPI002114E789|nr:transglutaminase-like domain-containing protein [Mycoplasmopsis citelli]UUD36485.1 transglutaminase-like domain-containing protein [Mycoplasmopsis citelli]